jgi:hypothetical protein
MKEISDEMPNDWNSALCFKCAQKEHFNKRKEEIPKSQKTLWDSIK